MKIRKTAQYPKRDAVVFHLIVSYIIDASIMSQLVANSELFTSVIKFR